MQRIAALRQRLALPEYRLIQRFFDATQLGDVLSLIRDVNGVARQDLQNSATSRSTTALARMQAKLKWLDVLFISFYATELTHILFTLLKGDHAFDEMLLSFAVVFVSTALVAYYLRPWHGSEADGRRLWPLTVFLVLIWIAALVFARFHWFTA